MSDLLNDIFSKCQCGFQKGHGTQHRLNPMTEKNKTIRDDGL